jgi:hypothetical protein
MQGACDVIDTAIQKFKSYQNDDAMQMKLKMHAVSMTPHAWVLAGSLTTHALSTNDSSSPGSL